MGERNINIGSGVYNEYIAGDYVGRDKIIINPKTEITPPNNLDHCGAQKFVGRDIELDTLHQQLQTNDQVAISAIAGMGGIGKTELALQYATRYWEEHYKGGVCWLRVRKQDLPTQIIQFAQANINLTIPEQLKEVEQKVQHCWNSWQPPELDKRALIIFDDVTDYQLIKPYLPPNNKKFKVLITTRKRLGSPIKRIDLDVLTPETALELLISLVGKERIWAELEIAKEICEWLGYLPLGIELVGKFLERKTTWNLARVKAKLSEEGIKSKPVQKDNNIIATTNRGVSAAFAVSWKELTPAARELGCYLSLFAVAPISWDLIKASFVNKDLDTIEDLIDDYLINLNLLKFNEQNNTYSLHQLIREYFQTELKQIPQAENLTQTFCQVMLDIAKSISENATQAEIETLSIAIPHLSLVAETLTEQIQDKDLSFPFIGLRRFYASQSLYELVAFWDEQRLNTVSKRLGENNIIYASSLHQVGFNLIYQGRQSDAITKLKEALNLRKKLLGKKHVDVADTLDELGLAYRNQSDFPQARKFQLESLQLRALLLGKEKLEIILSENNVQTPLQEIFTEAEMKLVDKLAESYNGLANLYLRWKNSNKVKLNKKEKSILFNKAEKMLLNALIVRERISEEGNNHLAYCLHNLAELYRQKGKWQEAENQHKKALEIRKRIYGEKHHYISSSVGKLADFYFHQAKYKRDQSLFSKAESNFIEAIRLHKCFFQEKNIPVPIMLKLAKLYEHRRRFEEAISIIEEVKEYQELTFGTEHDYVMKTKRNLERLYGSTEPGL